MKLTRNIKPLQFSWLFNNTSSIQEQIFRLKAPLYKRYKGVYRQTVLLFNRPLLRALWKRPRNLDAQKIKNQLLGNTYSDQVEQNDQTRGTTVIREHKNVGGISKKVDLSQFPILMEHGVARYILDTPRYFTPNFFMLSIYEYREDNG